MLGVGVPLAVALGWLAWRAMRYRLTDTELQVESGVLTTRSRRVPLARLQSVDVVRPLFARFLGLAELRMEVVGGGAGAEAPLSYLSEDDAEALRVRLLQLASGRGDADGGASEAAAAGARRRPAADRWCGRRCSVRRCSCSWRWSVVLAVVAVVDLSYVAGPAASARRRCCSASGRSPSGGCSAEYGFTVAEAADGLRLQQGLLDTRSSTIPPGRVQTVRVTPAAAVAAVRLGAGRGRRRRLRRRGRAAGRDRRAAAGRPARARRAARRPGAGRAAARRRRPAAALAPGCARRRRTAGWRSASTSGTWCRRTASPRRRPTSSRWPRCRACAWTQGPWQRRLGLSSLHVDTAGRRLPGTVALHRGDAEGRALLARADRARRGPPARRSALAQQVLEVGAQLGHGARAGRRDRAEAEEAVDEPVVAAAHDRHARRPRAPRRRPRPRRAAGRTRRWRRPPAPGPTGPAP